MLWSLIAQCRKINFITKLAIFLLTLLSPKLATNSTLLMARMQTAVVPSFQEGLLYEKHEVLILNSTIQDVWRVKRSKSSALTGHMTSEIRSTLAQVMAQRHQAITWTNVDWSSVRFSDIHQRAMSRAIPQPSISKISMKNTYLKFHLYTCITGVNKLTWPHVLLLIQVTFETWHKQTSHFANVHPLRPSEKRPAE